MNDVGKEAEYTLVKLTNMSNCASQLLLIIKNKLKNDETCFFPSRSRAYIFNCRYFVNSVSRRGYGVAPAMTETSV